MAAFWDEMEPGWTSGVSYEQPRTDVTVTQDLGTGMQSVDNSGTGSGWSAALAKGFGQVLNFGLQRQAAKDSIALQERRQVLGVQPLVSTNGGTIGVNPTGLLLIGGLVLAVVLAGNGKV